MSALITVKEVMSLIKDGDYKYVVLITACSKNEIYSNFYSNFPYEMKELNVTLIEFRDGCIILHTL